MAKIEEWKGIQLESKLSKSVRTIVKRQNKKKPIDYGHPAFQYTSIRKPENFVTNPDFWYYSGKYVRLTFIFPFAMFLGFCTIFGQKSE